MVAAITNLLFYDVPANLLFHEDLWGVGGVVGVVDGLGKPVTLRFHQVATGSTSKIGHFSLG